MPLILMTVTEAANEFELPRATINRWVKSGRLKSVSIERKTHIEFWAIKDLMKASTKVGVRKNGHKNI